MQNYVFIGGMPRFYPNYEGRNVSASVGDVFSFEVAPGDGNWVLAPDQTPASPDEDWFDTPATQEKAKK